MEDEAASTREQKVGHPAQLPASKGLLQQHQISDNSLAAPSHSPSEGALRATKSNYPKVLIKIQAGAIIA